MYFYLKEERNCNDLTHLNNVLIAHFLTDQQYDDGVKEFWGTQPSESYDQTPDTIRDKITGEANCNTHVFSVDSDLVRSDNIDIKLIETPSAWPHPPADKISVIYSIDLLNAISTIHKPQIITFTKAIKKDIHAVFQKDIFIRAYIGNQVLYSGNLSNSVP